MAGDGDREQRAGDREPRRGLVRVVLLVLVSAALLALSVTLAWAFAEEPLPFRDPITGGESGEEISTLHFDLSLPLALAAGFSMTDSVTLQVWNQLVDSEVLGAGSPQSYTNCAGAFYPAPDPRDVCGGQPHRHQVWPRWDDMKDQDTCALSRFGPYSPFFHFPHDNAAELDALREWAWGRTEELVGYEAYAWGRLADLTVVQAECHLTRTVVITTGVEAGSLEAFATYLHSLADYYSHRECIDAMDAISMPWATHTLTGFPACDYNPSKPRSDDVHGREFGDYADAQRTDEAVQHIYRELTARALRGEGRFFPLAMDGPVLAGETLAELLYRFVHEWSYDEPANRRWLADQMTAGVLAIRRPMRRLHLPLAAR